MKQATLRLHLQQPFLASCEARITEIHPEKGVATDITVAFAEGGGQEGDHGTIITDNGAAVPFTDTQKGYGRLLLLADFPSIQVDTPVYHKVAPEDLDKFRVGQPVKIIINVDRRIKLTVSHSGIHAVLYALERIKPDIYPLIRGCSIRPETARLDFALDNESKFSEEHIIAAREFTNQMIRENWEAVTYAHPKEAEAMYWKCGDAIWACGGTHLPNLGKIGEVMTSKKNLGANMQRVTFTFPNAVFNQERFVFV